MVCAASAHALMVKVLLAQVVPLAGPCTSKWWGGGTQARLATAMVHALAAAPAASVHFKVPEAATLALIAKVAVPALPEAQMRLTFCNGAEG